MMEIDRTRMQDLCTEYDIDTRWDYSGRFIFGEVCFGIVGSSRDLRIFTVAVLREYYGDDDIPAKWHENVRDSMGLDMIFYWPGIVAAPEPEPADRHGIDKRYDESDSDGFKIVD